MPVRPVLFFAGGAFERESFRSQQEIWHRGDLFVCVSAKERKKERRDSNEGWEEDKVPTCMKCK